MKKQLARVAWAVAAVLAIMALIGRVDAQPPTLVYGINSAGTPTIMKLGIDPCSDPGTAKSSVAVNISSATTTQLVAPSGSLFVYTCGFSLTFAGTAPSLQFITGTGATCGTGTATNSGTYLPTVGSPFVVEVPGTLFKSAAGAGLCAVSAGTGPSIQGVLQYVQQAL